MMQPSNQLRILNIQIKKQQIYFQYQMNRRIVYKQEAKCNFCSNWFQVFSEIKFGLNICQPCIYKALNTSCFKLPTPSGHLYQVYLAQRNISMSSQNQWGILEKVDDFMHSQIRQLLQKWQQISKVLKPLAALEDQEQTWRKAEFILKNDNKSFQSLNNQTLQQLNEDMFEQVKKQNPIFSTPMKEKDTNMGAKITKGSARKALQRNDSKKQLKSHRGNTEKRVKGMVNQQNTEQDNKTRNNSPISQNHLKRTASSKRLNVIQNRQNKDFSTKMQIIKNNITSCLEVRGQNHILQPLSILKERIYEAIQNTNCINKCIQLVSYHGLQNLDMKCYLSNLNWQGVQVVKFVKVGLTDEKLQVLLEFIKDKKIETLVLTSNNLTEESCRSLMRIEMESLKNIYLGKNQIFSYKARNQIKQLKSKYNFFL